jgi:DNA-binding CsgD family transcriptional regulator
MGKSRHFSSLLSAVAKLWNTQETLQFKNIRLGRLQYFFAFPLAMTFAFFQHYLLRGHADLFGLNFFTIVTIAFCIGAIVFLAVANEKTIVALSKASSILALAGLLPYLFLSGGVPSLVCAIMLMMGIGGCVSLSSYSFGFVLNNTERVLGSIMGLFLNGFMRILTDWLLIPKSILPGIMVVIALGIILSLFFSKSEDFDLNLSGRVRYDAGIWLAIFIVFAYFITKAFGINIEDFQTDQAAMIKSVSIMAAVLLCTVTQMFFKRSIWTMCNVFFIATIGCYAMNRPETYVFASMAYGFKEIGFIVSFYVIGCVTNRFSNYKMHKILMLFIMPAIIPIYVAIDLLSGNALIYPLAVGVSSLLFVIFLLLSPAFSKHLFSADWSDSLNLTDMSELIKQVEQTNQFENLTLTPKEKEIAALILRGEAAKQIAVKMGISVNTVNYHTKNLYKKLNISSRTELFARFNSGIQPFETR